MPRITDFNFLLRPEHPAITIRTRTSVDQIPELLGSSFMKIGAYLESKGEMMTDIPFVAYHGFDQINEYSMDMEIGFHITNELPDENEIKTVILPERLIVFCMYKGAYSEMIPVYEEMKEWILRIHDRVIFSNM